MFKNLRDRLKGVSKKLEDELEAELEEQLEQELADELARDRGDASEPQETTDTGEAAEEARETPAESEAAPATTPGEPEDEADLAPDASGRPGEAPEADEEPGGPGEDAGEAPSGTGEADAAKTAGEGTPDTRGDASEGPEGRSTDTEAPDGEAPAGGGEGHAGTGAAESGPSLPEAAAQEREPSSAGSREQEAAPEQRSPAPAAPEKTEAKRITGRKELSTEEIETRLRSELEEAVDVQRDVESVVRESGATVSRYTINEDVLEDILWELEVGLLESDVALPVIEAIKDNVKEQLLSMSVAGRSADRVVEKVLRTAIRRVLNVGHFDFDAWVKEKLASGEKPLVVMFVGVNGTGKTTSIARIAHRLKGMGISSVMAAGDTFRAGAIEQLALHGDRLGVRVVKHSARADPAAVAYDAIEHAKARRKDVVLLDTAGRMQTNTNLMDEMDKIRRVADPDLVVFVGDSLAGNDAVEQARRFDEVVDIDGAILTKVDVDAKGGAALSVAYTINKPLLFVGVGQDYDDIRPFDTDWMVDRLFGTEGDE